MVFNFNPDNSEHVDDRLDGIAQPAVDTFKCLWKVGRVNGVLLQEYSAITPIRTKGKVY